MVSSAVFFVFISIISLDFPYFRPPSSFLVSPSSPPSELPTAGPANQNSDRRRHNLLLLDHSPNSRSPTTGNQSIKDGDGKRIGKGRFNSSLEPVATPGFHSPHRRLRSFFRIRGSHSSPHSLRSRPAPNPSNPRSRELRKLTSPFRPLRHHKPYLREFEKTRQITRRDSDQRSQQESIDRARLSTDEGGCSGVHRDPGFEIHQRCLHWVSDCSLSSRPCVRLGVWTSWDGCRGFSEGLLVCYYERCDLGCDEAEFSWTSWCGRVAASGIGCW